MPNHDQFDTSKTFIFKNGRLLERQLCEYFFGDGTKTACLKALAAYQNEDGGFGNGLEPDLLCPASSAIGAETAIWYLELLESQESEMAQRLVRWIVTNLNAEGFINHPPPGFNRYPFQEWWANSDLSRVFWLAGTLKKWEKGSQAFFTRVHTLFERTEVPHPLNFYDYPYLLYLKYCQESQADQEQYARMVAGLPAMVKEHRDHYLLFSRYWFFAGELVGKELMEEEAAVFMNALQPDGSITNPYPQLPYWTPIFLLDGLILLKKAGLL